MFRVVTQQYGQGIVSNLNKQSGTSFPTTGNGGVYNDVCSPQGIIYLEVDLSCPTCPSCGDTLDGYTGTTIGVLPLSLIHI